jgi:hypothetical protein
MNKHFIAYKYLPIALRLPLPARRRRSPSSLAGVLVFRPGMLSHSCISNLVSGAQTRSGLMNGLTNKGPSNQWSAVR